MDRPYKYSIPIEVRFADVDALGHVNNAVYFTYMEQARVRYLQHLGLMGADLKDSSIIVAKASCQFKSPLRFGEEVLVYARVSELRNSSFIMEYQLESKTDARTVALGRTIQVYYDYQSQRSVHIPDNYREKVALFEGIRLKAVSSSDNS